MATPETSLTDQLRQDIDQRNRKIEDARLRAAAAAGEDPERARRVMNAAHFTGLPHQVVDADLDNLEAQILAQEFDPESYRTRSPAWTSFLAENPYHMAALEADQENMGYFERSMKQIGLGWDATWAQVEMGHMQTARMQQGGAFSPEQQARYDRLAELQVDHEFGAEGFVSFLVKNAKMLGPTLDSIRAGTELGLGGAMAGGASALIAGQAGPQAIAPEEIITVPAASAIGFKIGMASGAAQNAYQLERGFAYGEYREQGIDHNTALMAANSVGVVNAALETVGIGKVTKYVPWLRNNRLSQSLAGDVLTRPSVRTATANATLRFGEVLGTEIVTEVLQESVTAVTGELARPDGIGMPLTWDAYVDRISDTAIETLQGAAIISSIGPGMNYYADLRRARSASNMQVVFEQLAESAGNSTTRQNIPNAYKQFLERLRSQGMDGNVYIDAQQFATYFQDQNRDPEAVAADLGIDEREFIEVRELGHDLAIPTVKFAEKIAPTQAGFDLAQDLKANEDAMSAREAQTWRANNPKIVEQIEKIAAEAADSRTQIGIDSMVKDVTGQLIAAGYSQRASGQLAQIVRGIGVLAEREGMDPTELYEQVFGGVRRVTPEAVAARDDVDMFIDPLLDRLRAHDFPSQREMFGPSLMDFINDIGGVDPRDAELDAMDFRLAALDRGFSKAKLSRWESEGDTLDGLTERAAEAGYIADNDSNLMLEALRREIMGDPVFGSVDGGSAGLRDLNAKLDELAGIINEAGLSIDNMTNKEIREVLDRQQTFAQIDTTELRELTSIVLREVMTAEERATLQAPFDEGAIDTSLARAAAMLPLIDERQSFGDLTFTDTVTIRETGDTAKVKVSAQREFDRSVKRKNVLKTLLECLSG